MDFTPFLLSFALGLTTTGLLLVLAFPVAFIYAKRKFTGKTIIETITSLPIVLPPTVIGFYILIFLSPISTIGKFFDETFGVRFVFNFTGLVIASCIYSFPFMVSPLKNGFKKIPHNLVEASYALGKSRFITFLKIILPGMKYEIFSGAILTFAHTLGEFGIVLMIGGSIPGKTKVASIAIYEKVEAMDYHSAHIHALILIAIGFTVLYIMQLIDDKGKTRTKY